MDEQKFIEAFEKYYDSIFRFVYFRLNLDKQLAEDTTQDIFLKVWQKREAYDATKCGIRTWIYLLAKHYIVDIYKKNKRSIQTGGVDKEAVSFDSFSVENPTLLFFIHKGINNLSQLDKELIILRYIEEFEINEIAQIIGKSYQATKVAIFRAFNKLKKELNQNGR